MALQRTTVARSETNLATVEDFRLAIGITGSTLTKRAAILLIAHASPDVCNSARLARHRASPRQARVSAGRS